ncbi:hypothetical protein B808_487 [Fructilactobacillus florum 8D]|uniref:Uncharacterized protein n=1 Tax=Fructilactobacillus florum 8D TaxID=1221538 RepID=W9EH46_9LACO|nr:hypothetical protein B807_32 [Fructilactobacillus florum 2F]ETO40586.1 hypothetical protein B808_487 [Fructilactobacillus florum 8D]
MNGSVWQVSHAAHVYEKMTTQGSHTFGNKGVTKHGYYY